MVVAVLESFKVMNYLKILAISVIVCTTGSCVRHDVGSLKQTKVLFATVSCDCGPIKKGLEGICRFTFTNTGKHDLQISLVHSTWDCIKPTWTREVVKPGKNGEVNMVYKTDLIGAFSKSIYVQSNAKDVTLNIKGIVTQ